MYQKFLLISDLHFTNKPADEYRWNLKEEVLKLITPHQITDIVIMGDLTDAKDFHSGTLVNKVVDFVLALSEKVDDVYVLRGNHDGLGEEPYFEFLRHYPDVHFVSQPEEVIPEVLFLPHSRNPMQEWKSLDFTDKIVMTHATVNGALAESLIKLESQIEPEFFNKSLITFSGDIHKPQTVGPVHYVGSPYNVRFGDNFDGGGIIYSLGKTTFDRVLFDFPKRITIDCVGASDFEKQANKLVKSGQVKRDRAQVKVRMTVTSSTIDKWRDERAQIEKLLEGFGWLAYHHFDTINETMAQVHQQQSFSKMTTFDEFCDKEKVEKKLREVGKAILEEVK